MCSEEPIFVVKSSPQNRLICVTPEGAADVKMYKRRYYISIANRNQLNITSSTRSFREMNMSVPSCPLALTNPIQLHTLRCSGGPYAPKSSYRHAKTCLEPPDIQFDMCFTYIDELILAQIEDSCSWEH